VAVKFKLKRNCIMMVALAIGLNVVTHGVYTLKVIFSETYSSVISNEQEKLRISALPLYFPTLFLLQFDEFGYSDSVIRKHVN
jgi:hypothetical protein